MNIHTKNRLLYSFLGAMLFALLGFILPYVYFRYFDNTPYYSVVQPIPMNQKWYKPCDETILTATRTSLIDTQASFSIDLVLKKTDNGEIMKVPNAHYTKAASVAKGRNVTVDVVYPLPCSLTDGLYYWQATMKYSVRGFEKQYTYVSDTFNVNNVGVSPDAQKLASESAELDPKD